MNKLKPVLFSLAAFLVFGCAEIEPKPFEASPGHIKSDDKPAGQIPELVQKTPVLPVPQPPVEQEKYTVVVNEVPAKELLFALARDAKINVDIDPRIDGNVTINAVDQTLPQILDRVARQIDMRYEFKGDNLFVQPDEPFFKTYKVDYVNISRDTDSAITIATQIATTGAGFEDTGGGSGGDNNSTTNVTSISKNRFWETLTANVMALLGNPTATSGSAGVQSTDTVIPSPEAGFLTVKANSRQHEKIQGLIDSVMESANRQVLIQATIVEVSLSDQYQAGIDWSFLNSAAGISIASATLPVAGPLGTISSLLLTYVDDEVAGEDQLRGTVRLLNEFGDTKVLSSPQLMVLNNQTAILKVVDNVVFFTVEQETNTTQGVVTNTFETTVHTVPVGIVMSVTPQINSNESVMLNVRPTISRVNRFVNDPNPALLVNNPIPEIQVREMESLLRMNNNQIAVLGGLMQDEARDRTNAIPGVSRLPLLGKAFETKTKEYGKTELVIFLRPVVIRNPSLDGDLDLYKTFLDQQSAAPGFQGAPHP